jgi:hypothetical protein
MSDTETTDHIHFEGVLRKLLDSADIYDFVLLDAQTGTDSYAKSAAGLAAQCVIVSEYDPVSAQGIERLKILFSRILDPSSTWILFNKILPEFAAAIGEGLSVARYLAPIPWDADVVRAFVRRDLAIDMQRPNPYTLAISQVAYMLFPDETGEAIEKWRGSALQSATTPVKDRIRELRMAESTIEKDQARRDVFVRRTSLTIAGLCAATSVGALAGLFRFAGQASLMIENKDVLISFFAILAGFVLTLGVLLASYLGRRFGISESRAQQMTLELLHEEKAKLAATLMAAEGALKFSRDAGYYERRRRSPLRTEK